MITLEFEKFYLVNVYTPNSGRILERLKYRTEEWDKDFRKYIKKLTQNLLSHNMWRFKRCS